MLLYKSVLLIRFCHRKVLVLINPIVIKQVAILHKRTNQRKVLFILTQSLCTGELPTEWTQANVAPIFKKGSKLQEVNYRPVSLTCITCKLFEHIICKHILAHLEDHKILTDLQHGFRSGRSCETRLVTTFQDLAQMHNKKGKVKLTLPF